MSIRTRLAEFFLRPTRFAAGDTLTVRVDDQHSGWGRSGAARHDRDYADLQTLYDDALTAWRKNPLAWRIVSIVRGYVLGTGIELSSKAVGMAEFLPAFWDHRMNRMTGRLEGMIDELTRGGDLFVLLFRNATDGMSFVRFLTKDEIDHIETAKNDREQEIIYWQKTDGIDMKPWYSPAHPDAAAADAVCLHYSINRPIGTLFGEGDLVSFLPWLQRYSRLVEGRLRLHWALQAFLWFVTVPGNKVAEKAEQYRDPPEPGTIVVKEQGEEWDIKAPNLHSGDARYDIQAAFRMILAGAGLPEHWLGDSSSANLATAKATERPTERHLTRRQKLFVFMLQDIVYNAYQRAAQVGKATALETEKYSDLFTVITPDVSVSDNLALAQASLEMANSMRELSGLLPGKSSKLRRMIVSLVLKFAGEPLSDSELNEILEEVAANPVDPVDVRAAAPSPNGHQTRRPQHAKT